MSIRREFWRWCGRDRGRWEALQELRAWMLENGFAVERCVTIAQLLSELKLQVDELRYPLLTGTKDGGAQISAEDAAAHPVEAAFLTEHLFRD